MFPVTIRLKISATSGASKMGVLAITLPDGYLGRYPAVQTADDVEPMIAHAARRAIAGANPCSTTGTFHAPTITLEQANGFSLFMLKAVVSGRGDKIIDLAEVNGAPERCT